MTFKLFIKFVHLRHGMEGKVNGRWFSMSDIFFVSHFLSDVPGALDTYANTYYLLELPTGLNVYEAASHRRYIQSCGA